MYYHNAVIIIEQKSKFMFQTEMTNAVSDGYRSRTLSTDIDSLSARLRLPSLLYKSIPARTLSWAMFNANNTNFV